MRDDLWLTNPAAARLRDEIERELPKDWRAPHASSPAAEVEAWMTDTQTVSEAAFRARKKRIRREAHAAYYRRLLARFTVG